MRAVVLCAALFVAPLYALTLKVSLFARRSRSYSLDEMVVVVAAGHFFDAAPRVITLLSVTVGLYSKNVTGNRKLEFRMIPTRMRARYILNLLSVRVVLPTRTRTHVPVFCFFRSVNPHQLKWSVETDPRNAIIMRAYLYK